MGVDNIIEHALQQAMNEITSAPCPSRLAEALCYTVFPGGARVRPKLVLAVAAACSDEIPALAARAAVAVEFFHCASLVQDDLPCFDDAPIRRSKPSLHLAYDQRLAILVSDALIVAAYDVVSKPDEAHPRRQLSLMNMLSKRVGAVDGITAGQAWECEAVVDTDAYHRAKTGALFAAATQAGALACGVEDLLWARTGESIGTAYQIADDLHDVLGCEKKLGKPVHVDAARGRPNAVTELGAAGAVAKLKALIEEVVDTVPACKNADRFVETVRHEAIRFFPKEIARSAA